MAEGEQRRLVDIAHPAGLAERRGEVRRGLIRAGHGEADRQSARGVDPTGEHVGQGVRALLAGEEAADHGREPVYLPGQLVRTADEEDEDEDGEETAVEAAAEADETVEA